jgi:hypothetical protein
MERFLKFSIILSAVDRMSSAVGQAVSKSKAALQKLEKSEGFQALDKAANKSLLAGGAMAAGLGLAVRAAEESQVAQAKLEQVFRSMGETTGKAAKQAEEYASKLSMQIAVEDEAIMAAQTKLATFEAVSNETARMAGIFDRATAASFDLSAAGFGDAASTSVQLGKALQDPIKGITALRKSGVSFTEAEQQKIKALTQSGKLLEAQNMILSAVEKQVGGVAAASAPASQKMAIAMGEIGESIGKVLLPAVESFANWMTQDVIPAIQGFIEEHPGAVKAVAVIAGALLTFGVVVKTVTGIISFMNVVLALNPIVLIAAAIIAAAIAIIAYWDKVKEWFKKFLDWFRGWGKWILLPIAPLIAIPTAIIAYWDKIKSWFMNFIQWWKDKWNGFVDWVFGIPSRMFQAGKNIVTSIWDGMKSVWDSFVGWFEDGISSIREYLPFSPAKRGPLRDIHKLKFVETIQQSIKPAKLAGTMEKTGFMAKMALMKAAASPVSGGGGGASISPNRSAGAGVSINYAPVVNLSGGGSAQEKESFKQMLKNHQAELMAIVKDAVAREQRKSFA